MTRFGTVAKAVAFGVAASLSFGAANAATVVLDFSVGGTDTSVTLGALGNARTATAGGVTVRATSYYVDAGVANDAYLSMFAGTGFGSKSGVAGHHEVDNVDGTDFVLFQFDQLVDMDSAFLTTFFAANGFDADMSYAVGTSFAPYTADLFADGASIATVNALFSLTGSVATVGKVDGPRALSGTGNILAIAAAAPNPDAVFDGFKIGSLTVTTVVPEPTTWAMMITGFGLVGGAMRTRRAKSSVRFA